MADVSDIPTITALITRAARAFVVRDSARTEVEAAQKRFEDAEAQLSNVRAAFALFDLAVGTAEDWSRIRDLVGAQTYDEAVNKGIQQGHQVQPRAAVPPPPPPEATQSNVPELNPYEDDEGGEDDEGEQITLFEGAAADRPSIRELALERLRAAGAAGTKARAIRDFIEKTYKIKLHYKTVGMTLYRLSRDGLARREGQTWFIVPHKPETMNPGGGTPGLNSMLE